jgi:hypothetical protein
MSADQAETSQVTAVPRCTGRRRLGSIRSGLVVIALLGTVGPRSLVAGPEPGGRILAPARGAVVNAGELVEVRWTDLDRDVEEFELLLSLDDGRHFSLRLTVMLDPRLRAYAWRVPNLPAEAARLRVRAGRRGREVEAEVGESFRIVGARETVFARPTFHDGELWLTPAEVLWLHGLDPSRTRVAAPEPVGWAESLASDGSSEGSGEVGSDQRPIGPAGTGDVPPPRPRPRDVRAAVGLPQRE